MSKFRNLLQKMGIVQSVEEPDPTLGITLPPEADSWPKDKLAEACYRADLAFGADKDNGMLSYSTPEEKWSIRDTYLKPAMDYVLTQEAIAEVYDSTLGAKRNSVPYAELDRDGKLDLLSHLVDWTDYVNRGLDMDTGDMIIFNAVDGKPPEKWLEQTPEEATARKAEMNAPPNASLTRLAELTKEGPIDELLDKHGVVALLTFDQSLSDAASRGRAKELDRAIDRE
jgi:hypothetical protein